MPESRGFCGRIGGFSGFGSAGIAVALLKGMELLGRLAAVIGISLALTLLLLVLYQDDGLAVQMQTQPEPASISQVSAASAEGTP